MSEKALYIEGEEYVQKLKTQRISVEVDFSLSYANKYKYTVRLKSVWSGKYFDWLTTKCNDANEIYIGILLQRQFYEDLSKVGVLPPSERTMKDVMKELVKERLLIRLGRGRYMVNPMIIWKEHSRKRIEKIKAMIGADIQMYPNVEVSPQNVEDSGQLDTSTITISREESPQEEPFEPITMNLNIDPNEHSTDNEVII
jgi:hypothetical protein